MVLKSDSVSIAATSSGVAGTITVPNGARLLGINLNWMDADGSPQRVELSWAGSPYPLKFVPQVCTQPQATQASVMTKETPWIDLRGLVVRNTNTVTITITSNANATVVAGLMWVE